MQTFLPHPNIRQSLECLDNKRLGKQRVEAMQLVNALERGGGAWFNHPAAQMWEWHEQALMVYHDMSISVWKECGFKNTMELYFERHNIDEVAERLYKNETSFFGVPEWFGNPAFHASHRSNLLRKDPIHYGQFGWKEPDDLPYVWPSKNK